MESLENVLQIKNEEYREIGSTHWFIKNNIPHQSLARGKKTDGHVLVSNEKITDDLTAVFEKKGLRVHVFGSDIVSDERIDFDLRGWDWFSSEELLPEEACDMLISIWYT